MGFGNAINDAFRRAMGIRKIKPMSKSSYHPIQPKSSNTTVFSQAELNTLVSRHSTARSSRRDSTPLNIPQLISSFTPQHLDAVDKVQNAERLSMVAPEIPAAKQIIISSMMSPNDLQGAQPTISIEDMPSLSAETVDSITNYLNDIYLVQHKLGEKMQHWAEEALFRSGAAVIVTLPEATLTRLIGNVEPDKQGTENFQSYIQQYTNINNKNVFSRSLVGQEHFEFINLSDEQKDKKRLEISKELKVGIEDFLYNQPELHAYFNNNNESHRFCSSLEAMIARISTRFEEGDVIKVSENPEVLRFGKAVRAYSNKMMNKSLLDKWKEDNEKIKASTKYTNPEEKEAAVDLFEYFKEDDKSESNSFNIEIPAEATIPICIPGSRKEKLGYFVLIDSLGKPIEASRYLDVNTGCTTSSRISSAYSSLFGNTPTSGGIQSPQFAMNGRFNNFSNPEELATSKVFEYVLDQMLRNKLENVGLQEVEFDKYEDIAKCMFFRMLEKKQTTLLFVPERFVTYVAFDYRPTGAGKSLIEDLSFFLSVRVCILVANVLAMMKNAVVRQEITITADEKEVNTEQLINLVTQAAIEKGKLNLSTNWSTVANSILEQSLSIKAITQPNAQGFNIERQFGSVNMPKVDSELIDTLDNWITNLLGVPHAAVNNTSEDEYAKSIATSNLFFAQHNRKRQEILESYGDRYLQLNISLSPSVTDGIKRLIEGSISGNKDDASTGGQITDGSKDIHGDTLDATKLVKNIVKHIHVSLPRADIAPNNAQYDILNTFSTNLQSIVDNLIPNEYALSNDSTVSEGLPVLKASYKAAIMKQFIKNLGMTSNFDIPEIDDFIIQHQQELMGIHRSIRNLHGGIMKDMAMQTTETTDENTEGTDSSSDSTSTDTDTDFNYGGF